MTRLSQAILGSLIKKANQRLRELEKKGYTSERAYERASFFAETGKKFMGTTKSGQIKFRTDVRKLYKEDRKAYYQLTERVKEFLGYETSKAGAVKKKYEKASKTFEKKYGIVLTPDQQKEIFGSEEYKRLENQYDSDVAITIIQNEEDKNAEHIKNVMLDIAEERIMLGDYEDAHKPQRKRGF